jgi:stearoyl-CoA desaturase (delta-9 desaturase)
MRFLSSSTTGAQVYQALALIATVLGLFLYGIDTNTLLLILLGYFMYGCLGIVVTFHRLLTHDSYKTHPLLVKILSVVGCMAGTGSPIAWVAIHINHHLKSDKEGDPHSPWNKGYSIFTLDYDQEVDNNTKWRMRSLITDKFQQSLHRYYFLIIAVYGLLLYVIGGYYLLTFLLLAPSLVTGLMSNVVNYVGHMPNWLGSYRSFNLNDKSANNWIWAIPSWGEAWHNNHHRFPRNAYFGQRWYEIDISGLVIKLIKT